MDLPLGYWRLMKARATKLTINVASVTGLDLELSGAGRGVGGVLLALPAFLPSAFFFSFVSQIRGAPLDPPSLSLININ